MSEIVHFLIVMAAMAGYYCIGVFFDGLLKMEDEPVVSLWPLILVFILVRKPILGIKRLGEITRRKFELYKLNKESKSITDNSNIYR